MAYEYDDHGNKIKCVNPNWENELDLLKELVDFRTPKKLLNFGYYGRDKRPKGSCPICNYRIGAPYRITKFCPDCGQRLEFE
jgi:hypothetical protein